MKREHAIGILVLALGGCAAHREPQAPTTAAVSTTRVTAADWDGDREDAPRVGKSQRSKGGVVVDDDAASLSSFGSDKDMARREDRRRGAGFSGWK